MEKMKHWQSYLLIGACIVINLCGGYLTGQVEIPFWLDAIGTIIAAIELGPVGGALTGALTNICLSFFKDGSLPYSLVSVGVGISVGLFFPKKKFDAFMVVAGAVFAGAVAVVIATPLNLFFNDGKTGNAWGDSLIALLSQSISVKWLSSLLAQAFIDIPDKALSMVIATAVVSVCKRLGGRKKKENITAALLLMLIPTCLFMESAIPSKAVDFKADYAAIGYDTENGLDSAEINAVAQTPDGYIWAGTYSGLYRYDGYKFERMYLDERISTVMQFFVDSKGNLWIGTNDSGIARYNCETREITFFTTAEGLSSNAIRAISEDGDGNIFVGTVTQLCIISPDDKVEVFGDADLFSIRGMYYSRDDDNDIMAGVTNGGELFFIRNKKLISVSTMDDENGVYYAAVARGSDGNFLVGTSADHAVKLRLKDDGTTENVGTVSTGGTTYFNKILYSKENSGYFYACENGLGFISDRDTVTDMATTEFHNSISDVIIDYQGNVWFASNKQGIVRFSWNPFEDIFAKAGVEGAVVNATMIKDGTLYVGSDNGLKAFDIGRYREKSLGNPEVFDGVRVRHVMSDSKGNIWVSTYGQNGLIEIEPDGNLKFFNEDTAGTVGGRFRSVIELKNGQLLAATSTGLNYIENGKVVKTMADGEGIKAQILSMVQEDDGTILAGSDGDGAYIIENGEIIRNIGEAEGLSSLVIMKVVPCTGGYIFVTSNALYFYDGDSKCTKLNKFPYSNNYDVYIAENGEAWITSSAGIFVVDEKDLLANSDYNYSLLNRSRGFYTTLTANATDTVRDSDLYLCCTDGVRKISMAEYNSFDNDYAIRLSKVWAEDQLVLEQGGKYTIPAVSGRISFEVAVLNFTLSNPMVHIFLEGTSDSGINCYQHDMESLTFTNLPYGDYKLHVQILDHGGEGVVREEVFNVEKESQLFERTYFKAYLIFVLVMFIFFLGWLIGRVRKGFTNMQTWKKEATTDPMTGLYNKAASKRELNILCKTKRGILMMIDLDSFKLVNDLYGHEMGDKILISFADIIRSCIRENDLAGRMGGDEFIAFLQGTDDESAVAEKTKYINEQIVKSAKELMGEDMNIPLGASIGAVVAPDEGTEFDILFGLADKALYNVKQNGKHGYAMYRKNNNKASDSEATAVSGLASVRKILGERNIGKGAYRVDFNKLQSVYRTFVRLATRTNVRVSIAEFVINPAEGAELSSDVVEQFVDILCNTLRTNDVVALNGKNQVLVILTDINDHVEEAPIERVMSKWNEAPGHDGYTVTVEAEGL